LTSFWISLVAGAGVVNILMQLSDKCFFLNEVGMLDAGSSYRRNGLFFKNPCFKAILRQNGKLFANSKW